MNTMLYCEMCVADEFLFNHLSDYSLHEMSCCDIVTASVRNNLSNIGDYYAKEAGSPSLDTYFGGSDNLVAAIAAYWGNYTWVLFRKKLNGKLGFILKSIRLVQV